MKKLIEFYINCKKINLENYEKIIPKSIAFILFRIIFYIILIIFATNPYKIISTILIIYELFSIVILFLIYSAFYIIKNKDKLKNIQGFNVITSAKLLGIDIDKDDDITIKKRYRELSKIYHPDKFTNQSYEMQEKANRNFQKLNTAYNIIKDYRKLK